MISVGLSIPGLILPGNKASEKVKDYLANGLLREVRSNPEAFTFSILRLFLGAIWLRAAFSKAISPAWLSGESISEFFAGGNVGFATRHLEHAPALYQDLMVSFSNYPVLMSMIVMLMQAAIGLSILTGYKMRLGIIAGIFLNINFISAGVILPSFFYIVFGLSLLASSKSNSFALFKDVDSRTDLFSSVIFSILFGAYLAIIISYEVLNGPFIHPMDITDPRLALIISFKLLLVVTLLRVPALLNDSVVSTYLSKAITNKEGGTDLPDHAGLSPVG